MTSSNKISGKSRTNTYVAIGLGVVTFALLVFLLLRTTQLQTEFGYLRDDKVSIDRQIATAREDFNALNAKLLGLQVQRDQLAGDVSQYQTQKELLDNLNQSIDDAQQKLKSLQIARQEAETVIASQSVVEQRRARDLQEIERLKGEIGDQKARVADLQRQESEANTRTRDAQRNLATLEADIDRLEKNKQTLSSETENLERQKSELAKTESNLKEKRRLLTSLETKERETKNRVADAQSDLDSLDQRIASAETGFEATRAELSQKQAELDRLIGQVNQKKWVLDDLEQAKVALDSTKGILESETEKLRQAEVKLRQVNDQASSLMVRNEAVGERLATGTLELNTVTATLAAKQSELDIARNASAKINTDISGLEQTLQNLESRVGDLQANITAETAKLVQVQTDLASLQAHKARFEIDQTEVDALKATILDLTQTKDSLIVEVAQQKALLEAAQGNFENSIRQHQSKLDAEAVQLVQARGDLATLQAQKARFEVDQSEAEALKASILELTQSKEKLISEIAQHGALLETATTDVRNANQAAGLARAAENAARAMIIRLNSDKVALDGEIQILMATNEQAQKDVQEIAASQSAAQINLNNTHTEISKLEDELEGRQTELARTNSAVEDAISRLDKLRERQANADNVLSDLLEQKAQAEVDLETAVVNLDAARGDLKKLRQDIESERENFQAILDRGDEAQSDVAQTGADVEQTDPEQSRNIGSDSNTPESSN